jgi:hypothetical protein
MHPKKRDDAHCGPARSRVFAEDARRFAAIKNPDLQGFRRELTPNAVCGGGVRQVNASRTALYQPTGGMRNFAYDVLRCRRSGLRGRHLGE